MNRKANKICLRSFGFLLGMTVVALIMAGPTSPVLLASTDVTKVVREYALTSANDFPQRDPRDWRLLGSNDGGKTWVVLDTRRNEIFAERQERRVFVTTNNSAFNIYRLQIDCVHDPAVADAVQLSDIELMGDATNDFSPTPLFCDLITAQGQNPPAETVNEIFDRRLDTKWLDTARQYPATRSSWVQWQYLDHADLVITNIDQLLSLQTRANENCPVRIDCAVLGQIPEISKLCFLDTSGSIDVDEIKQQTKLIPGQKVLLTGTSQWKGSRVGIQHLQIQVLNAKTSDNPRPINLEEILAKGDNLEWAETEGQIQFISKSKNEAEFDLMDDGRSVSVHVLHSNNNEKWPSVGASVRVAGLCEEALNKNGNWVAGTLWILNLDAVSLVDQLNLTTNRYGEVKQQASDTDNNSLLTQIDQIRRLTQPELTKDIPVKVRGVVTDSDGISIQDASGGIEIWPGNLTTLKMPGLGAYVEVEGRAMWSPGHGAAGYGPVIYANKVHFLGNGKLPNPIRPSWSLLVSGQMDAQWVEVEGVVRATDGSHLLLAGESGQMMATIRSAAISAVNDLVDATIRARGVSIAATDERGQMQGVQLVIPSLEFIEVLQPPVNSFSLSPRKIDSLLQMRGPKELVHRVKVEGVLTCFNNNNYFIQDNTGSIMAIAKRNVTLIPVGGWWSFWQSPKPNTAPQAETGLKVGDLVEAVGFPGTRGYAPMLTEAIIRKAGKASMPSPVRADASKLAKGDLDASLVTLEGQVLGSEAWGKQFVLQIQSDQKVFQAILPLRGNDTPNIASGSRVRVTGVCQMEPITYEELGRSPSAFSLLLRNASDISVIEPPSWLTIRRTLFAVGTLIIILLGAFVWIRVLHRQVDAQTQQLRQEITEHEKTEKLLDRKTQLLQQVINEHEKTEATLAERTELLKEEIKERKAIYSELEEKKVSLEREIEERKCIQMEVEKIHKQLLTTSRMAGMADVATNVLHNVGNVLNGVNVLATSIDNQVRKSKITGVTKLASLLNQHQANLGRFVSEDVNGKHVVSYLEHLSTYLGEEQAKLVEKVKLLTENIQHIKEIVAMQQNYAKVFGVLETVSLSEIVEDALKMCSEGFVRHQITIVRDLEEVPPVTLDRHKVLQILFNLLDNAKHACEGSQESERRITIRLFKQGIERVRVEVIDNGVGILQENLNRIFTQGFSTRKEGHGFGLHSSILAAQDMGGCLSVVRNFPAKGATFILEMPLTTKEAELVKEEPQILVH